jgi:hypothetical protein
LARRAPENDVYLASSDSGSDPNLSACQADNGLGEHLATRKVELVRRAMNRVDFNGGNDIEAGLLKAETHSARTSKKVDANRALTHRSVPLCSAFVLTQ